MKAQYLLAVDPGDKHVGWASWDRGARDAGEVAAAEAIEKVDGLLREHAALTRLLIIEEFRLYPWKAASLSFARMATSEMVGALKYLAATAGVPWVEQGASVMQPTLAQARQRGTLLPAAAAGRHAAAAELHLLHYLFKSQTTDGRDG